MHTDTVILPSFLASALINGDISGLEGSDHDWLERALEFVAPGCVVDVGETYFGHYCDLPRWNMDAELAEYTILYHDAQ
jgi:hypothetical protein